MRACNADGCGSYSTIKSVSVSRELARPTFTSATLTKPSGRMWEYSLAWTASPGATHYELWGPDNDNLFDQVRVYLGPETSQVYGIWGFEEPYTGFTVRACNDDGCSPFSSMVLRRL